MGKLEYTGIERIRVPLKLFLVKVIPDVFVTIVVVTAVAAAIFAAKLICSETLTVEFQTH